MNRTDFLILLAYGLLCAAVGWFGGRAAPRWVEVTIITERGPATVYAFRPPGSSNYLEISRFTPP